MRGCLRENMNTKMYPSVCWSDNVNMKNNMSRIKIIVTSECDPE